MNESPDDEPMRALLRDQGQYYTAPADLRADVMRQIRASPNGAALAHSWLHRALSALQEPSMLRLGASFAAGALVALVGVYFALDRSEPRATLVALTEDHARSVVTGSTIEVPSSDQHTVKPWLSSRLGYSPAVFDLAASDFPLLGGRRGYLGGVPVAVMVYAYKAHEIDVYALRPDVAGQLSNASTLAQDGYCAVSWEFGGLRYVAISDVDRSRLRQFSDLLLARQQSAGP